jgi:hypothetical protein
MTPRFIVARPPWTALTQQIPSLLLLVALASVARSGTITTTPSPAGPAAVVSTYVWDGGGANDNWTTAANWEFDVEPVNDGTAQVIFASAGGDLVIADTPRNVASMTANNSVLTNIIGEQITVGAGGITCNDVNGLEIDAPVALSANQTFTAADAPMALFDLNLGSYLLTIAGAADVFLVQVSGTGSIAKTGSGLLDLGFGGSFLGFSSLTTSAGLTILDIPLPNATITNNGGTLTLHADNTGSTLKANGGTTNILSNQSLAALNIGAGGTVILDSGAPANSGHAVPEPGHLALIACGIIALLRDGRRRIPRG